MSINRKLAGRVADAIEGRTIPGLAFYMGTYGSFVSDGDGAEYEADTVHPEYLVAKDHHCKTSGCMASWAVIESGLADTPEAMVKMHWISKKAGKALGLEDEEAEYLFASEPRATDTEAVAHLRILAAGGPLDWSAVNPGYATFDELHC